MVEKAETRSDQTAKETMRMEAG